jgi:prevent-host-death family protein
MKVINLNVAKAHLSRWVDEAAAGAEIIITKAGQPVAKLVPLTAPVRRRLGALEGKAIVPDDFDAPLPDAVIDAFEGR